MLITCERERAGETNCLSRDSTQYLHNFPRRERAQPYIYLISSYFITDKVLHNLFLTLYIHDLILTELRYTILV